MRRVVKFLYHTRRLATFFVIWKGKVNVKDLAAHTDSDWACDQRSRKCTLCAVVSVDGSALATVCRGQSVLAQSSAEAEVYAAVMGLCEALHLRSCLHGWESLCAHACGWTVRQGGLCSFDEESVGSGIWR